jgi:cbb3-type cytochrome oxidase subunit 3
MKLSDIMSAAGLSLYAEVALVLFFAAFVAIVIYVMRGKNCRRWEEARHIPLHDEEQKPPFESSPNESQP